MLAVSMGLRDQSVVASAPHAATSSDRQMKRCSAALRAANSCISKIIWVACFRSISAPACKSFAGAFRRSEEHTSELQSLMRISYAVFCLKKQKNHDETTEIKIIII